MLDSKGGTTNTVVTAIGEVIPRYEEVNFFFVHTSTDKLRLVALTKYDWIFAFISNTNMSTSLDNVRTLELGTLDPAHLQAI